MRRLKLNLISQWLLILSSSCLLIACLSEDNKNNTAQISFSITDAAIDIAEQVNLDISGIELKSNDDTHSFTFASRRINLLELQGSQTEALLTDEILPAGEYQWVRLMVDGASIVLTANGGEIPLTIPSSEQSGFKLVNGFTLPVNSTSNFTIDFDVRKSITVSGAGDHQSYKLKPTMRLTNHIEAGHVAGSINTSLCDAGASMAVYAYTGEGAIIDDEGSNNPPVTSSLVSDNFDYNIGFLTTGNYTLALTCEADEDLADSDDDINFVSQQNIIITAKITADYPFN